MSRLPSSRSALRILALVSLLAAGIAHAGSSFPSIAKSFSAPTIPLNGTTTLTFTLSQTFNPSTGLQFIDNFPPGLVIATPNGLSVNSCGGTLIATAGTSIVSLSGAAVNGTSSCGFSVNVVGTSAGLLTNITGNVSDTNNGVGNAATASLTVVAPPNISKFFGPNQVAVNGTSTVSISLSNPNTQTALTMISFSDSLPPGIAIAPTPNLNNGCGGNASASAGVLSLNNASLAAAGFCSISVDVVAGTQPGNYVNTTTAVTSLEGGTGGTGSATLDVVAPPQIVKTFNPSTIPPNGTTSLDFTITNPVGNVDVESGVNFTDTLPAGPFMANATQSVCGGTNNLTITAPNQIALSGGTIAANGGTCSFSVPVTAPAAVGSYVNITGPVGTNFGDGVCPSFCLTGNSATATLTVPAPPTISKNFGAASIPLNGSTSLNFTIDKSNPVALSGVGFSDNLPAGLVVATPTGLTGSCGGGTITATPGSAAVSLAGATLAANASCNFSVNVTGVTAGTKNNTTGNVSAAESGSGNTASASLAVVAPPTIAKSFGAASIPLNGSTSLSFTVTNADTTSAVTGVAFSDTLPGGLVVTTPNGLIGTCGGGTITATAGAGTISLTGATLPASASCTFSVNVTGTAAGAQNNVTGNVSSTNGGTGNKAAASVTVVGPPTIAKNFGAASIPLNGATTLSFTITNSEAVALTGVAFSDSLPAGLVVSTPNGLTGSCGGGTITATAGSGTVSLTGASLAANASCNFSVNVIGTTVGTKNNVTGNVTSTNGGTGNTASASLQVAALLPPTIGKSFAAASIPLNGTTTLSFTLTNPNPASTLTGIGFTDPLPAGLVVSTPSGLTGGCGGGTITATAGSNAITLAGATLPGAGTCSFSVSVTGTTVGAKNNITGSVSSAEAGAGGTAAASLQVAALLPPTISKAFGAASVALNGTTTLSFTVNNPNPASTLTGIAFTDSLPAGLSVANPNGLAGGCGGGVITANAGSTSVSLAGATLAGGGSCTFVLGVTATGVGTLTNITGAISSLETGAGGTSNAAVLSVAAPLPPVATPTLGAWALLLLAAALLFGGLRSSRSRLRG